MKQPQHWQAIYGSFAFETTKVTFRGGRTPQSGQISIPSDGLAMSDVTFSGGTINTLVRYQNALRAPSVQIVLVRSPIDNSIVTAGIEGDVFNDTLNARFVVNVYDATERNRTGGSGFRALSSTPWVESTPSRDLKLRVFSAGSWIDLYADDVLVLRHILNFSPSASQCGVYVRSEVNVELEGYSIDTKRRSAFVIMKFSPPFEHLFKEVIKPIADTCGMDAEKADDILGPGIVISDITRRLQEADVVIADISVENANVYYELGYAHALGKPTILLAEKGKALPFDISGFRTLFYENSIAGKSQIEEGLEKHLEAIVAERPL